MLVVPQRQRRMPPLFERRIDSLCAAGQADAGSDCAIEVQGVLNPLKALRARRGTIYRALTSLRSRWGRWTA